MCVGKCSELGTCAAWKYKRRMSERPRIDREILCAILNFGPLKTIKSDSMDEHADLSLGFAIIVWFNFLLSVVNCSQCVGGTVTSSRSGCVD